MADLQHHELYGQNEAQFRDFVTLLKPRVMSLVVFTAFVGLVVAPVQLHPFVAFCSVLFIALGGGASGVLNMWYDRDIDAIMRRTARRPIPAGLIEADTALAMGIGLAGLSCLMLGLAANWFAAGFLAFTIFFYAVVYTIWLKRSTPQNIVIGGAAGAFPPMIGWACATGGIGIESLLMFALIFFWTPPHFWALALFVRGDYAKAGVPMLTVTHGHDVTRRHIFAYCLVLAPVALSLGFTSIGGPVYLVTALVLNALFVLAGWRVLNRDSAMADADRFRSEKAFFKLSLYYLFGHFMALLVQHWLG